MRAINVTTEQEEVERRLRARVARLENALGWMISSEEEEVHIDRPNTLARVKEIWGDKI